MAKEKDNDKSSVSLNGETDLEGKMIIDSNGDTIGKCMSVNIGDDGQIGLTFETEINEKLVVPSKTIPYSAIGKITDVIELKVPINIKIAKSADEIKTPKVEDEDPETPKEDRTEASETEDDQVIVIDEEEITEELDAPPVKSEEVKDTAKVKEADVAVNVELPIRPEKLLGTITETPQADATEQLSKTLKEKPVADKKDVIARLKKESAIPVVEDLMTGLEDSIKKLDSLFKLLSNGEANTKIEAIKALTSLTKISAELGLSLIPKMLKLTDEPQQDVRLAIAQQLEIIGEVHPELFRGYFLEILENAYEEPIEEIREQLAKALLEIAIKKTDIASEGLEEFLEDVIIGKRVPEVPSKVLHDITLKVVSGNFQLTRISIKVRLKFIIKGGKLAERCAEELEDYNATLIGLALIESFSIDETEKLVRSNNFKKLGPIFVEVIQEMINAYKEGSFNLLSKVIDKKTEIPITVIERFYETKISQTLLGVKNVPMEVFLENSFVTAEEAEQIIYRLIVQKRINAAITMNNDRTFITTLDLEELALKKEVKPKTTKETPKKSAVKKPAPKKPASKKTTKKPKTTPTKKPAAKPKASTTKKKTSTPAVKKTIAKPKT
ncbi:MAG: hypothetical protein HZR80_05625 [Candidatus Heimdallarchaeota archaeon]